MKNIAKILFIVTFLMIILSASVLAAASLSVDDYFITENENAVCRYGRVVLLPELFKFYWFRNGGNVAFASTQGVADGGDSLGILTPNNFNPGDEIYCEVWDYANRPLARSSTPIVVQNDDPVTGQAQILPYSPKTNDNLACTITVVQAVDPSQFDTFKFYWYKNGATTVTYGPYNGANVGGKPGHVLSLSYTKKGDTFRCEVRDYANRPLDDASTIILNTPPTQPVVDLNPKPFATTNDPLICSTTGSTDVDPSDSIRYYYRWYRDEEPFGADIITTSLSLTLDSSDTKPGEEWKCRVTPWDGDDYGTHGYASPIFINTPPTAVIDSPNNLDVFDQDDTIEFDGSNSNDPDVGGSIVSYVWTSDKDGYIGSGASFTKAANTLTRGQHIITLTVTDNLGAVGTASVTITVVNDKPVAVITLPQNGAEFDQDDTITFDGRSSDDDDGSIRYYRWFDGTTLIGTGSYFTKAASTLTLGAHTITLEVTDNLGAPGTVSVKITVVNENPVAVITLPVNGAEFDQTETITFDGSNSHDPDGTISYRWTANGNEIGNTATFTKPALELGPGQHVIDLEVTDNLGAKDTATVRITVLPNKAPEVSIKLPSNGDKFREGEEVKFAAISKDPDGIITELVWESSKDGEFRTVNPNVQIFPDSFSYYDLSVGEHTITLKATDNENAVAVSLPVNITVTPLKAPRASIYSPTDNSLYKIGDDVIFSGAGDDYKDQGLIKKMRWFIDGTLERGVDKNANEAWDSFKLNTLAEGAHTIVLEVEDDSDLVDKATVHFTVWDPTKIPAANIASPETQSDYKYGIDDLNNSVNDIINFIGIGIPAEDNAPIVKYLWYSNLMGNTPFREETSPTFSMFASELLMGKHELTLVVEDNIGRKSLPSAPIIITVKDAQAPTVWIISPETGDIYKKDVRGCSVSDIIHFIGDGEDSDGEVVLWEWFSSIDGKIGSEKEFDLSTNDLSLGRHDITLVGTDNDDLQFTDTYEVWIILIECHAPDVEIISPADGSVFELGDDILFEGTAVDPDGGDIEVWIWYDVNGLGELKSGSGDPADFTLNTLPQGYHEIRLQAVDDEGSGSYDTVWIYIGKEFKPPIAEANGPYTGIVDITPIPFTSIGSNDSDGTIEYYEWDFENDGIFDAEGPDLTDVLHIYDEIGEFTVNLCVTDNDGLRDCDTAKVTILEDQPMPPVAEADGPYVGFVKEDILLVGEKSYDPNPDGRIVKYVFDFGDGATYTETETNAPDGLFDGNTVHVYDFKGNYTFTLTVTDNDAEEDSDTSNVEVKKGVNYPTAVIEITGKKLVGETLTFDGSGSIGNIVNYAWDIDGQPYMNSPVVTKVFDEPGIYTIGLAVVNDLALGDYVTETIEIKEDVGPIVPTKRASIRINNVIIPNDGFISLGDTAEFIIKVENDGDYDLEDVKIAATMIDFGIRGTAGPFELDKEDSVVKKIVLEMPEYELEDYYILRISVRAETSNGENLRRVLYREVMLI